MNSYLQEKLKRQKLQKKKSDMLLKTFLIIMLIGYAFFFSSNYFFPKIYRNLEITDIGKTYSADDYIITVDSWDYMPKGRTFEIILEMDTFNIDDKKPEFNITSQNKVIYPEVTKVKPNYYILIAKGLPRKWADAALNITYKGNTYKLYMNDKEVNTVKAIKNVKDKYIVTYAKKEKIKGLEKYIAASNKKIKELEKKNIEAYEKLNEMKEREGELTEKEKEVYNNQKNKLTSELSSLKSQQEDLMDEINAAKEKIELEKGTLK